MINNSYWKKRAENYNKTNWVHDDHLLDAFLALIPQNREYKKILEVGIGTGMVANKVVEMLGPIIGLDKSSAMMSRINHVGIEKVLGDAHSLPFQNNYFDLIYIRNVVHYLENPEKAFSEIRRCLKPDGIFLFSQVIPFADEISKEYDDLIGRQIHYPTQQEILHWFNSYVISRKIEYILKEQSIMNWLNNTCNDNDIKQNIVNKHKTSSIRYKSLVNYFEKNDDMFVDVKHLMIRAQKQ